MNVFLCGGVRSGKSSLAQQVALSLSGEGKRYYLATMIPTDGDDRERIRLHLLDREGMGFETVEQGRDIAQCLARIEPGATVLLDSVTALLMNEAFPPELDYALDDTAGKRCCEGLTALSRWAGNVVFVSDLLFSDARRYDAATQGFRRQLGNIHCHLASLCDTVAEVSSGLITMHKGVLPI